jgi:hypothetical protein
MLLIIFVPSILLFIIFRSINQISAKYFRIQRIENANKIGLEYFVTYIIPFLNFNLGNIEDIVSILILFGFMLFMYIRSDLIYMNPILNVFGYNVFKIISEEEEGRKKKEEEEEEEKELMLISKKERNEINDSEELKDKIISEEEEEGRKKKKRISEEKELMLITKKERNEINDSEQLIELANGVLIGKLGRNSKENSRIS